MIVPQERKATHQIVAILADINSPNLTMEHLSGIIVNVARILEQSSSVDNISLLGSRNMLSCLEILAQNEEELALLDTTELFIAVSLISHHVRKRISVQSTLYPFLSKLSVLTEKTATFDFASHPKKVSISLSMV